MIHVDGKKTIIRGTKLDTYEELASLSRALTMNGYSEGEIINSIKIGFVGKEKDIAELALKVLEASYESFLDARRREDTEG